MGRTIGFTNGSTEAGVLVANISYHSDYGRTSGRQSALLFDLMVEL